MPKFLTVALMVVGFCLILGFQNCAPAPQEDGASRSALPKTEITATVVKPLNLDGCRVLLCAQDNVEGGQKCFIPLKMDSRYIVEGNVVKVKGKQNFDAVSTCMAGDIFEVQEVELLSGSMNNIPGSSPAPFATP